MEPTSLNAKDVAVSALNLALTTMAVTVVAYRTVQLLKWIDRKTNPNNEN